MRVMCEGEVSTPREIQAGMSQSFVLAPILYSLYTNVTPNSMGPPSPLCWWHVRVCDRSQGRLCSQKAATRPHLNGVVVWALEH